MCMRLYIKGSEFSIKGGIFKIMIWLILLFIINYEKKKIWVGVIYKDFL